MASSAREKIAIMIVIMKLNFILFKVTSLNIHQQREERQEQEEIASWWLRENVGENLSGRNGRHRQ